MPSFGYSFDPSQQDAGNQQDPTARKRAPQSVQNAIQYLSLRMPKVVGAQSPVMPGLLSGIGAGGPSPHVEAIVNQVLGRVLGPQASGGAPSVPPLGAPPASGGFSPPQGAAPTSPQSQPAGPSPLPPPRFGFSEAAPDSDMRPHQVPPPDMRPHELPIPIDPGGRAHELPPSAVPRFNFDQPIDQHGTPMPGTNPADDRVIPPPSPVGGADPKALLDEARRRVGTGGDWNQYQSVDDPFVKLFAQTFGRGDWNTLK